MHLAWHQSLVIASIIVAILGVVIWILVRPVPTSPEPKVLPLALERIHLQFRVVGGFDYSKRFEEQEEVWRESLRRSGEVLQRANVKKIILLHGTFVGSDPVNFISSVKSLFPKMSRNFEMKMGRTVKTWIDQVAQDNGNFVPAYVKLMERALGEKIPVALFSWSSANHHLARLEGALRLIEQVLEERLQKSSDRVLLIGHSHARQVFALFTQLVQGSGSGRSVGGKLWEVAVQEGLVKKELREGAKRLRKQRFDFVTLGGPVRYSWAFIPDMRVLHIINHRGETESIRQAWAFWKSGAGDFVQQWGMIGSDTLATTPRERQLNRRLDALLGKGLHTRLWFQSIVRRNRLGDFGRTLLVDYQYEASKRPNFLKSVFGHGIYTRFDVMHFQLEKICKYIYG